MAKVKVTLKRSLIGRPDNPAIRGQLHKVEHLIQVEEIAD